MKHFESVYNEMSRLLTLELPEVISKINEEKNDGIILEQFSNKTLQDKNLSKPYFSFKLSHTEKTSKDILIENTVFKCEIEIFLNENESHYLVKLWRYFAAIDVLIDAYNATNSCSWQNIRVSETRENKIIIRVVV